MTFDVCTTIVTSNPLTVGSGSDSIDITRPRVSAARALHVWLAGFTSVNTRRAYEGEMRRFAKAVGADDVYDAAEKLLALDDGPAHAVVDTYRADLIADAKAPATINRSMAALNSFVRSARRHGLTTLRLEARKVKSQPYRDTAGPGTSGVQKLLNTARSQRPSKAVRDTAIIRLLFSCGLRRGEIASLDICHVDLAAGTLQVMGKGRTERESITLVPNAKEALASWMEIRGVIAAEQALFVSLDHPSQGNRLSGWAIWKVVTSLGEKAGMQVRPHGLRHTAITSALDVFDGDFRKVKDFSRHANIATVAIYDDRRNNAAGQVSQAIDALVT